MRSLLANSTLVIILTVFVSATAAGADTRPASDLPISSMILLQKTVHFTAPDGTPLSIDPGGYLVESGDRRLRLSGLDGQPAVEVAASPGNHEESIKGLMALSFAEGEGSDADIHHIVLLSPDGRSLDAVGTYSGVAPRGLGENLAQRPLIQKALQAKEAAQAQIHDRLFGAPPPFSLGPNAFNTVFNENAVGASPANAYLLTYLATLIYPDYLDQLTGDPTKQDNAYVTRLQKNPQDFVQEYANLTHHLFWNSAAPPGPANQPPQYVWVWGSRGGQDPEAMVISTPKAVYVVFRGTDRVGTAKKQFGYEWGEWLETDFVAVGIAPDVQSLQGLVHAGFWLSLTAPASLYVPAKLQIPGAVPNGLPFRDATLAVIKAFGGGQKKVWVTGHSLGAAHVQLYGAYLTVNGLPPQGVYAFAAPHVGDHTFVKQLNSMFPNQRLQRFDFVLDPVTQVPPNLPLPQPDGSKIIYARAGTRVYYDDVRTVRFGAPERPPAEAAPLAAQLNAPLPLRRVFAATNSIADICFHYPQWHLNAAYNQLDKTTASRVPSPLPTPVMRGDVYSVVCGPIRITRGNVNPQTGLGNVLPGR